MYELDSNHQPGGMHCICQSDSVMTSWSNLKTVYIPKKQSTFSFSEHMCTIACVPFNLWEIEMWSTEL